MREALFWEVLEDDRVRCRLCPHGCVMCEGASGICGVRRNVGGRLQSLVYGLAISAGADPIEKKPLFHVRPASRAYSIATVGCNLKCAFCQNSDISQYPAETGRVTGDDLPPALVVEEALRTGCEVIAYTYTEPTIYIEYALDTARIAKAAGIRNVFVTNGYIEPDVVRKDLKGLIDAANIDLKAFSDSFYRRLCGARLGPVLEAIGAYHASGIWIELTTLLIPGENDSDRELREIAGFIRSLSADIPWHISRYYPRYKYDAAPPTAVADLERARNIGLEAGLNFVYTGNVMGHEGESTYCPSCGRRIITRRGFQVAEISLQDGRCAFCNHAIAGRF